MKLTIATHHLITLMAIATAILMMAGCSDNNKENDLNKFDLHENLSLANYNLSGNVKSFKEATYKAEEKNGEIVKGEVSLDGENRQLFFNKKGNLEEEIEHSFDGSLGHKNQYQYNKERVQYFSKCCQRCS